METASIYLIYIYIYISSSNEQTKLKPAYPDDMTCSPALSFWSPKEMWHIFLVFERTTGWKFGT